MLEYNSPTLLVERLTLGWIFEPLCWDREGEVRYIPFHVLTNALLEYLDNQKKTPGTKAGGVGFIRWEQAEPLPDVAADSHPPVRIVTSNQFQCDEKPD